METKLVQEIEIFVASPSDLSEERAAIGDILDGLNETYLRGRNKKLVPKMWEKDTHTKYSGTDPQLLVNGQIGDKYDAVLVIFWARVGSSTPRAISGTIEELERAIARFKTTKKPHIMPYFKIAGVNPLDVDLGQLKGVQKIHSRLRGSGLVFEFSNLNEFKKRLQNDIIKWLEEDGILKKSSSC